MSKSDRHSTDVDVHGKGYNFRFSKGLLAHTLKTRGIPLTDGYKIARKVHQLLIEEEINDIDELVLRNYVKKVAFDITGKMIDDQYILVEQWHDSSIPLVILISGSRGIGKSEIGRKIATRFAIPKIVSTSTIAQILRKMITADLAPELHSKSYNAYKKLRPIYSIMFDPVLIGYEEHAKFPAEAVEALVKRGINENASMIIRGEHLVPRFLSHTLLDHPSIIYITLSIPDEKLHLERYLDKYDETEHEYRKKHFPAIRKIHDYLIEQVKSRNYMLIDASDYDIALHEIELIIYGRLKRMFSPTGKIKYHFRSYDSAVINS